MKKQLIFIIKHGLALNKGKFLNNYKLKEMRNWKLRIKLNKNYENKNKRKFFVEFLFSRFLLLVRLLFIDLINILIVKFIIILSII